LDERLRKEIEGILGEAGEARKLYSQADQALEALSKFAETASKLAVEMLQELLSVVDRLKPFTPGETAKVLPLLISVLKDESLDMDETLLIIFVLGRAYERYLEVHGRGP